MRIEICGGIASGKTTLCTLLNQPSWQTKYENFHENPFWALFYKNSSLHAFETEVTFLLQHYCQIKIASEVEAIVCDFSLLQDRAYSKVNLRGGRLDAFQAVYAQTLGELPPPSLIVHLVCSAEEELARIGRRARAEENSIKVDYLDAVNQAISSCVDEVRNRISILTIDSERNNFATDAETRTKIAASVYATLGSKNA